jgi:hypothetical protein
MYGGERRGGDEEGGDRRDTNTLMVIEIIGFESRRCVEG